MKELHQDIRDSFAENCFLFKDIENEAYNLQIPTLLKELLGATDKLSNYTCHSQPHVVEVMQQADMLFVAFREWFISEVGFSLSEMQIARKHLLLSAKFHDIGMAGSSSLRELLKLVDELHSRCKNSKQNTSSYVEDLFPLLDKLAHTADSECSHWDGYKSLCGPLLNRIVLANDQATLCPLLESYHEQIKNTIRKYHGELSAKWIIENQGTLSAYYGNSINWEMVALLSALHTGPLFIHHDDCGVEYGWLDYCNKLCSLLRINNPLSRNSTLSQKFLSIASILRIADQRRSGNNLRSLDKHEIETIVAKDGRIVMKYEVKGVTNIAKLSESNEVIVSEKLNNFGSVIVHHSDNRWLVEHELHFSCTTNESGRYLLLNRRIPSYLEELQGTMLKVTPSLHHVLCIELCDPQVQSLTDGGKIVLGVNELLHVHPDLKENGQTVCFKKLENSFQQFRSIKIKIIP